MGKWTGKTDDRPAFPPMGCPQSVLTVPLLLEPQPYDAELYKSRHAIENKFQRLKVFRRVSARFEKTRRMFFMFVIVAISVSYEKDSLWPSI